MNEALLAIEIWERARDMAVRAAELLDGLGAHKQIVNRLLEPFSWVQVIVSSTEWDNFWKLRHPSYTQLAQPEMMETARVMKEAYDNSKPNPLGWGDWHVPTLDEEERWLIEQWDDVLLCAVGRLARVSYEVGAKTPIEDVELANKLKQDGHWSPFEHVARVDEVNTGLCRNFRYPFAQFRAILEQ